ncbi:hypothetical protein FRC01_013834, partial [Tulasnella sp. 417]
LIGTIVLRRADVRRKRRLAMLGEHIDTAVPGPQSLSTPLGRRGYLPVRTSEDDGPADAAGGSAEEVERMHLKDDVEVVGGGNPWLDVIEENPVLETAEEQERGREHPSGHHKAATFPRMGKGGMSGWLSSVGRSAQQPGEHSPPLMVSPIDDTSSPQGRAPPSYNTLPRRILPHKDPRGRSRRSASFTTIHGIELAVARTRKERRKGKIFMAMSTGLVLATWALFFATALAKINGKEK